jgi:hypothetical protein
VTQSLNLQRHSGSRRTGLSSSPPKRDSGGTGPKRPRVQSRCNLLFDFGGAAESNRRDRDFKAAYVVRGAAATVS